MLLLKQKQAIDLSIKNYVTLIPDLVSVSCRTINVFSYISKLMYHTSALCYPKYSSCILMSHSVVVLPDTREEEN